MSSCLPYCLCQLLTCSLNLYVKNKSVGKQPLGKTLMIVLQPQATPPGTVSSLSGTETSAGHIQTDWGFVLGLSASETKWEFTGGLCFPTD